MTTAFGLRRELSLGVLVLCAVPVIALGQGIPKETTRLRTSLDEIRAFRETYVEAYNKKDTVAVANMYNPNAVVIQGNGNVLVGRDAIQRAIATNAPNWTELAITSDTLRVVGKTAWDVGTSRTRGSEGGEQVYHYLSVLRRGTSSWKIERLALVPESHEASGADSTKTR
jgi:uncharacterized protein (TIGR02246 family)